MEVSEQEGNHQWNGRFAVKISRRSRIREKLAVSLAEADLRERADDQRHFLKSICTDHRGVDEIDRAVEELRADAFEHQASREVAQ